MVGISSKWQSAKPGHGGMVKQVSGGARPRRGSGHCHWSEPMVVTENSLFPCTAVPPGACTCCWHRSCLHPLPAPGASPDHSVPSVDASGSCQPRLHLRASPPSPAPEGRLRQQPLLTPAAGAGRNHSAPSVGTSRASAISAWEPQR